MHDARLYELKAEIALLQYHTNDCRAKMNRYLRRHGGIGDANAATRDMDVEGIGYSKIAQSEAMVFIGRFNALSVELKNKQNTLYLLLEELGAFIES